MPYLPNGRWALSYHYSATKVGCSPLDACHYTKVEVPVCHTGSKSTNRPPTTAPAPACPSFLLSTYSSTPEIPSSLFFGLSGNILLQVSLVPECLSFCISSQNEATVCQCTSLSVLSCIPFLKVGIRRVLRVQCETPCQNRITSCSATKRPFRAFNRIEKTCILYYLCERDQTRHYGCSPFNNGTCFIMPASIFTSSVICDSCNIHNTDITHPRPEGSFSSCPLQISSVGSRSKSFGRGVDQGHNLQAVLCWYKCRRGSFDVDQLEEYGIHWCYPWLC